MRKSFKIISLIIVLILSYIVVAPYQYSMTALEFYAVTIAYILLSCLHIFLFAKSITLEKGIGIVFLLSTIIFALVEINHQIPNLRIKLMIEPYVHNAPIKILGFNRSQSASLPGDPSKNELNEAQGSRTIFLEKAITPGKNVDRYTVLFKRPLFIDRIDVSRKTCFDLIFCNYHYVGFVLIDPDKNELIAFSVMNKGVGK
ncbi:MULTISPECIES: hypothetical protein [unclassified Paenibacillus]|uniref:hypothetical protein n=1 Tax=unclassified Paenibacillus TaxID=185978 RepID=UPI00070CE9E9|nr:MULTISPECIES: hypothetical protein [unclassified Paenibacillus]KQX46638.1 hypothetical protein ASD40_15175 [Paenibacillus sp. Root444D2]KRE34092.1 hypothetical protein ASG85_11975 [Paenibacillus sp. Soil724D2]